MQEQGGFAVLDLNVAQVQPNAPVAIEVPATVPAFAERVAVEKAADGATLVTSEQARGWFEQVLANPNTIRPDAMATSGRRATVTGVSGERTFSDGDRTVRIYMIDDSVHARGFMMVWLLRERLLVEADAYTPGPPNAPPPAQVNANNQNMVNNIERLKPDVDRNLPLHGRMVPASELYAAVRR